MSMNKRKTTGQPKRKQRRSMPHSKLAIVSKLPGTDLFVVGGERQQLEAEALRRGILPGHYEAFELMQFGNAIAASRDEHWQARLDEHFRLDLSPLLTAYRELRSHMESILRYVRMYPDGLIRKDIDSDRFLYPFDEKDAGKLGDLSLQVAIIAERLDAPLDEHVIQAPQVADAIRLLINGRDGGQKLRDLAEQRIEASKTVMQWVNSYRPPGAPTREKRDQNPLDWLCEKVVQIYLNGDHTQASAYDGLYEQLDGHEKPKNSIQADAWHKLQDWQDTDPVGNLWRNVRNRPHLKALLENGK